jgi:glycosyltransferase involved in cell wall biosynthesis
LIAYPKKISVVTLTADRRELFPIAIHSIRTQEFTNPALKPEIEWVIVENGHTRYAENLAQVLNGEDNGITVRVLNVPPGEKTIGGLRNYGVSECNNDVILFMDDDD